MPDLVLKPTPLQNTATPLVLASGSAIRKQLLHNAGLSCLAEPVALEEDVLKAEGLAQGWAASTTALRLAEAKALALHKPEAFVIGADQMLSCEGVLYNKPETQDAARTQLQALRGKTHTLHTAVVVCHKGAVLWQNVSEPKLTMRSFSDTFLDAYLQSEGAECLCSVGAYRLEGPGLQLFEQIEGDYSAILGLPLLPLLEALRNLGVTLS
ncbi:nucleoside triphosphate pyrophosphatase [Acetobacter orientalis]|uniref:Maf family protein n=1 Tax=Acetobacter orientalis TaxID=146474 RepID=UPI00242028F9|nr:nucleoside triphosphate pyrophosphatase [Acetobacter orientalis]